jgi:hypothetical protein
MERPRQRSWDNVAFVFIGGMVQKRGTPKFLPSTSAGTCLNQSWSRNVLSSSKSPS